MFADLAWQQDLTLTFPHTVVKRKDEFKVNHKRFLLENHTLSRNNRVVT